MADPRADAVRSYLATIGVRTRAPAPRRRGGIVDDDDVTIGAARMEPDDDVQIGSASMVEDDEPVLGARETRVPEIRIVGDARRESPRIGSVLSAMPEWMGERARRAIDDDESMVGEYFRTMADAGDRTGIPDLLSSENLDRMETFGRRGIDALLFGWGEEISGQQSRTAAAMARSLGASTPYDERIPGDDDRHSQRGFGARPDSAMQREQSRGRQLRQDHPYADLAGAVAGSLPGAVLTPGPTATTARGRIAQSAAGNAGLGIVQGAGLSDGDLMDRAPDAAMGGLFGGVGGGVMQTLGEGAGLVRRLWQARNAPGPILEGAGDLASESLRLSDGPAEADAVRRLTRAEDAVPELSDDLRMLRNDDEVAFPPRSPQQTRSTERWTDRLPRDPADDVPFDAEATYEAEMRQLRDSDPQGFDQMLREDSARRARMGGYPGEGDITPRPRPATMQRTEDGTAPGPGRGRGRAREEYATVRDDELEEVLGAAPARTERLADVTDVADDVTDAPDEFLGAVSPAQSRAAPRMPESGPSLRAAAIRGERSFGARGDAAADPSIQFADELSAMSREYADIEGGVGGFQPLKERRVRAAMQEAPPPDVWRERAGQAATQMRSRLEQVTRAAGADSRIARHTAEARFALDELDRLVQASEQFGAPLDPADVYRQLNRANMSVGRAAAAEGRQSGMGMQHTTAFAEPLTESYQTMRSFLMDEGTWGAAARVQQAMNASTAPLLRTGRALRDRAGSLFQDSAEATAQGGGFRTYEQVRPEVVRGVLGRVGDDAYASERQLLRDWITNYGEQGATLARIADDPALAPQARAMQDRAGRLLDILDRAEVEGRAAQLLQSVADARPGGQRMPSVGQMVRLVARIESGEITAPEMGLAMRVLGALEGASGAAPAAPAAARPLYDRSQRAGMEASMSDVETMRESPPAPAWMRDMDDAAGDDEDEDDTRPRWMRDMDGR